MPVSEKTRRAVCERENLLSPNGHDYHHCFFKSEWFFDVDSEWNGHPAPRHTHDCIHHPATDSQANFGHKMEILFKKQALERFMEKYPASPHIEKLEKIIKRKEKRYGI